MWVTTVVDMVKKIHHFFYSPHYVNNKPFQMHYRGALLFLFIYLLFFMQKSFDINSFKCQMLGDIKVLDSIDIYCYTKLLNNNTTPYEYEGEFVTDNRLWFMRLSFVNMAIISMTPQALWLIFGGSDLKEFHQDDRSLYEDTEVWSGKLLQRMTSKKNFVWMWQLYILESVNVLSCLANWILAVYFIDEKFWSLGPYISFKKLEAIFPTEYLCCYELVQSKTVLVQLIAICEMSNESWNHVLLAFLWVHLVFQTVMALLNISYRSVLWLLKKSKWFSLYHICSSLIVEDQEWVTNLNIYDWLFLSYVSEYFGKDKLKVVISELRRESASISPPPSPDLFIPGDQIEVPLNNSR